MLNLSETLMPIADWFCSLGTFGTLSINSVEVFGLKLELPV